MEERIARIISIVFHPLLIPTYIISLLLSLKVFFALVIPFEAKWKIAVLVLITSAIFPLITLYGMYRFRMISSLLLKNRDERLYPYIATCLFFSLSTYMIWQISISPVYYYALLGASILAVFTLLINIYWKISAHAISMGGVLGILVGLHTLLYIDLTWLIALSILISGLVGFARLRSGSHSQAQIYSAYLLGFLTTFLLIRYF
jgi:hypothetical protein